MPPKPRWLAAWWRRVKGWGKRFPAALSSAKDVLTNLVAVGTAMLALGAAVFILVVLVDEALFPKPVVEPFQLIAPSSSVDVQSITSLFVAELNQANQPLRDLQRPASTKWLCDAATATLTSEATLNCQALPQINTHFQSKSENPLFKGQVISVGQAKWDLESFVALIRHALPTRERRLNGFVKETSEGYELFLKIHDGRREQVLPPVYSRTIEAGVRQLAYQAVTSLAGAEAGLAGYYTRLHWGKHHEEREEYGASIEKYEEAVYDLCQSRLPNGGLTSPSRFRGCEASLQRIVSAQDLVLGNRLDDPIDSFCLAGTSDKTLRCAFEAMHRLAVIYDRFGQHDRAVGYFQAALKMIEREQSSRKRTQGVPLLPGDLFATVRNNRAVAFNKQARYEAAHEQFRWAIQSDSLEFSNDLLFNQALTYQQQGMAFQAVSKYHEIVARDLPDARTYYNLAIALEACLEAADCSSHLREAKAHATWQGDTLWSPEAAYQKALSLEAGFLPALINLGHLHLLRFIDPKICPQKTTSRCQLHKWQALAWFQKALNDDPDNTIVLNNLGVLMDWDEQLDQAAEFFQRAVNERPNFSLAQVNLAKLKFQLHEFEQARATFEWALRTDGRRADAFRGLWRVAIVQGRCVAGLQHLKSAITLYLEEGNFKRLEQTFTAQGGALHFYPNLAWFFFKYAEAHVLQSVAEDAAPEHRDLVASSLKRAILRTDHRVADALTAYLVARDERDPQAVEALELHQNPRYAGVESLFTERLDELMSVLEISTPRQLAERLQVWRSEGNHLGTWFEVHVFKTLLAWGHCKMLTLF